MPHLNFTRDPDVTIGPYRILQRVDGRFILYDERRPAHDRGVGSPVRDIEDAIAYAYARWEREEENGR